MRKETFNISGMTCAACAARVEKAVAGVAGVERVSVNLLKNSMVVGFNNTLCAPDRIIAAVESAGYGASVYGAAKSATKREGLTTDAFQAARSLKVRLIVSVIFTAPLFYLAMGHMVGLPLPECLLGPENALAYAYTQFLLLVPVIFINFRYYQSGFRALYLRAPNMDSLIAVGSGAATVFGIYAVYKIGFGLGHDDWQTVERFAMNLYFESAAMILTLITLGKFFEAGAKGKTSEAIAGLAALLPETALVLRAGVEALIPAEQLVVGDIVVVKTGERIPVDGVLVQGNAAVDESVVTGESLPVDKQVGDPLTSAAIVQSGHLLMRATRVGGDTTLAQIVKLVDEATSSKAPIARLADRISGVFVPVVIGIAGIATLVWLLLGYGVEFALSAGISVLVISCPCALGLATPTSIMVGAGRGARNGILFKSARSMELAHSVDTVVLDKTGTVTEGRPQVTDIFPNGPVSEEELLGMAASLEKQSEHPLGAAIVAAAENRGIELAPVTDFSQKAGQGISGTLNGKICLAGNAALLRVHAIPLSADMQLLADKVAAEAKTALYFACAGRLLGMIAIADAIKPGSRQAVAELAAMGINVVMMTGDNARSAAAVQSRVGIERVLAEVLPQDKEQEVRSLQEQGRRVAMVGDGVNDAPALARADVGIAIGAGTDIAVESADIVLMHGNLLDVVGAVQLSRAVMRNIRQNLFWAFFYNSISIPVAAGVFYGMGIVLNPMIAAAAMSLSSVCVVLNALRLRSFRPQLRWNGQEQAPEAKPGADVQPSTSVPQMRKLLKVEGMNCGHCVRRVEKALRAVPGVLAVVVSLETGTAEVIMEKSADEGELKRAVAEAGFTVTDIR